MEDSESTEIFIETNGQGKFVLTGGGGHRMRN
ncbi:hypothetical protein FHS11_005203 [Mucilaginibacter gotjawali]|uniref:Uncharacterized protein n=1 Tax=Mucilaginibacter gotjawali TaxID=1550579 RepID=A0A839SKC9_9SPHI|nr:hypothetical protein [Mucilaginibacter gotjawali]